jgi:hypothetical protein
VMDATNRARVGPATSQQSRRKRERSATKGVWAMGALYCPYLAGTFDNQSSQASRVAIVGIPRPLLAIIGLLIAIAVAIPLLMVYGRLSAKWMYARASKRNKARSLRIRQTYSVRISEGVIQTMLRENPLQCVRWSEVEEVGTTYRRMEHEMLVGWVLKSPGGDCFVPFDADGEAALEKLISTLPHYRFQGSIVREASHTERRFVSLWRRDRLER